MTFVFDRTPVIVDASVVVELMTEDRPELAAAWARWVTDGRQRLAPPHLLPETGNALLRGARLEPGPAIAIVEGLEGSGLEIADRGLDGLIAAIVLAHRHGLSVYDALYLQLAIDVDGSLATYDKALARAAAAEDVELEPLGD